MKKSLMLMLFFCVFLTANQAFGGIDHDKLDALVQAGVLTNEEAEKIKSKQDKQNNRFQKVRQGNKAKFKNNGFSGKYVARYINQDNETVGNSNAIQMKLNLDWAKKIDSQSSFHIGLATGGADARSHYQTLGRGFQNYDLNLNYAYGSRKLSASHTVTFGKIKNPIYNSSQLLWDKDINIDGLSVSSLTVFDSSLIYFDHITLMVLDELHSTAGTDGAYGVIWQPGVKKIINENLDIKAAVGLHLFKNVKEKSLSSGAVNSGRSNSLTGTGLTYDYNVYTASGEVNIKNNPIFSLLSIYSDVVFNPDPSSGNKGYLLGVNFGDSKLERLFDWRAAISYRHLGKDAWFDIFSDSISGSGLTNIKGFDIKMKVALLNKSVVSATVSMVESLSTSKKDNRFVLGYGIKF